MNTRIAAAFAVLLASTAVVGGQQAPQPEPPVFRVQVDAIELDAFVTDAQGNPVTDLTADDFEVIEDGRPQAITSFSLIDIPIDRLERPLFSPRAIEPDVRTNTGAEGRVYVIAVDEVSPQLVPRTRLFLRRFIEQHFAANDLAALVYVGRGRSSDTQDFTSSQRLLLTAVDKVSGGFPADLPVPAAAIAGLTPPTPGTGETEHLLRNRMKSLRDLTEFMGRMRGRRKALLYFTNSLGIDVFNALDYNGGTQSTALEDLHGAITAATRGNVSIYPIDPAGLSPTGDITDDAAPAAGGTSALARIQDLRTLAEATGGFALVNSNSVDQAFTRIVRENSTYYVLGFTSTNERRDGRFRRVQVQVRRPGLTVRARNGYLAPMRAAPAGAAAARDASAVPAAVADALGSAIAVPSVPMRVFVAPYKGADRQANVAIAIELDSGALGLTDVNGTYAADLAVATTAIASGGKVIPGQRHQARLALRPDTYERTKTAGIRVLSEIQLPPGRYQIRVAGGTPVRAGSVIQDVEVADFTRDPLMMSGVSLTSSSAQNALTVRPVDPLMGLLPGPIIATRDFSPGDTLTLYTEVYENLRNPAAHTVSLKVDLRTDDGRVVSTTTEERSSKELGGKSGGYGFIAQVPLDKAEPGIYVVHVEAQANIGARPTVARDVQIRVR